MLKDLSDGSIGYVVDVGKSRAEIIIGIGGIMKRIDDDSATTIVKNPRPTFQMCTHTKSNAFREGVDENNCSLNLQQPFYQQLTQPTLILSCLLSKV